MGDWGLLQPQQLEVLPLDGSTRVLCGTWANRLFSQLHPRRSQLSSQLGLSIPRIIHDGIGFRIEGW
jgi:hypothetical protein